MRNRFTALTSSATGLTASILFVAFVFLAVFGPIIWAKQAGAVDVAAAWKPPSLEHLFGTDQLGRDLFARTMTATRLSLLAACAASLIAIVIGIPLGLLASAFGYRIGQLFSSVIGIAIAFPALLTAMFVGIIIGIGIPGAVLGIGIALAPVFARLTQTLTASVTSLDYVAAARTMGVRTPKLITRHILPNVAEPLIITAATSVGLSLLGISALSFLGLGARPPQFDWGELLSTGLQSIYFAPLGALGPGAMIALAGITFSMLGEAIAALFGDRQSSRGFNRVARAIAARSRVVRTHGAVSAQSGRLLAAERLAVTFPSDTGPVQPVREVTLELAPGSRTGVVGESGSGKSLTVLALAQLVDYPGAIDADRIEFLGTEIRTMPAAPLRRFLGTNLAMVFQNPMSSLNPAMRIGTQVTESARVHRGLSRAEARDLAIAKLTEVGIPDGSERLRQYPHEFSGGMRQRAMIAMGLTEAPKLIIADEPTTALDVTVQRQILDLLDEINRTDGTAILLISHDIAVVADTCERVIVMYAGHIVEDLPSGSLLKEAAHPYTRALIDAVPDMHTDRELPLATIPGRPPTPQDRAPGCPFADRCRFATDKCREERPELLPLADGHSAACWHPQGVFGDLGLSARVGRAESATQAESATRAEDVAS